MNSFFHGAVDVLESSKGLVPLRFTPAQMTFFEPLIYRFRSYNAAGIRLQFLTDSPFFEMSYEAEIKPDTTEYLLFDVFVDDVLFASPGAEMTTRGSSAWRLDLPLEPGHPRCISVYLPYLAKISIQEMKISPGSIWKSTPRASRTLLCLGDSITQGMNACHPSSTYAALLARFLDMELLNQAVSGYVFNADTLDPELPCKPHLITVAYGTNDWVICETLSQFRKQAEAYLEKLVQCFPNTPIVIFSPLWRTDISDSKPAGSFEDFRSILESLCARHSNIRYIDGLKLLPHLPSMLADGLHPTDEGFLHMALNIAKLLR